MFGLLHHLLHPTNCYALCSVARSGAHLLSSALRATHLAGRPLQYFNEHLAPKYASRYGLDAGRNFHQYVRSIVAASSTSNSVFGFRIEGWEVDRFVDRLREVPQLNLPDAPEGDVLRAAFPRLRYIQLTRQDKLAQAISKARALQTNLWVVRPDKSAICEPKFDLELIEHCLLSAQKSEQAWTDFFRRNGIVPLATTYEELCADYSGTVTRVLDFVGVRLPRQFTVAPPGTARQADGLSEEWARRYREIQTHIIAPE